MPGDSSLYTSDQEHLQLLNALRESELLRDLSELLASSLDPTHILQVLVRRTTEVCAVERCAVWLLDQARSLYLPSAYHVSAQRIDPKEVHAADKMWHRSSLPFDDPLLSELLRLNAPLYCEDLRYTTSPAIRIISDKFYVRSVLLVPLVREGRPLGLMSLDNPGQKREFSLEQERLARSIGQQAAIAIDNARLYQQAQTERSRAERLTARAQSIYKVAMAVNSGKELSTILDIATHHLVLGVEAEGAAIALLENDVLTLVSSDGLPTLSPSVQLRPHLTDLPYCYSMSSTGTMSFVTQGQLEGIEKRWFRQMGLESAMVIPLLVGAQNRIRRVAIAKPLPPDAHCVGFAFVNCSSSLRHPSQGQFAYARDIATQCALAIERSHILADARQAAALATERANTLDAVLDAMSEGIIVLNTDGQVIVSNNTASHFLGLLPHHEAHLSDFLNRYPTYTLRGHIIPPNEFPLSRALRGEQVNGERFFTSRSDGSERAVELNVAPLFDGEARQVGLVSAFRDVTEQVRVEHRIRRVLDTMLHAAEVVSGVTNFKGILERVLFMALRALNCGRGVVQLYEQEQQKFTPLLSLGFSPEAESQWLAEQKSWLSPEAGQYAGFRTQILEGHATLVSPEQCPDHPSLSSEQMALAAPIIYNNNLFGVIILDRSVSQVAPERLRPNGELHTPRKRDFNIWDLAVLEGIAQFAGLAIEQAHWQQEAEIARSNEALMRESNALKDEFLALTAHEFRTPLTVILAHTQMVGRILRRLQQEFPNSLYESIATIEIQTHQLTNIVNTFLEVTQLNRGQIILNMQEIDLVEVVEQAIHGHSATAVLHDIRSDIASAEYPYFILGDKARLQQIFGNLIQNAIKYSMPGGPITVSLAQLLTSGGDWVVEVCVEDKGIGVPLDAQAHLFERFYRASNIQGSQVRGVGLGLYVVAEFLRLHGGSIRVESSGVPGEGSRFIFTLPLLERVYR